MSAEMRERALALLNTSYLRNVKEDTVIDGVEIKSIVNYMILFHEQESQPINEFNKETIEAGVSWMNKYLKAEKETAELRETFEALLSPAAAWFYPHGEYTDADREKCKDNWRKKAGLVKGAPTPKQRPSFTDEELQAIETDVRHIVKCVTLDDKQTEIRNSVVNKIAKGNARAVGEVSGGD